MKDNANMKHKKDFLKNTKFQYYAGNIKKLTPIGYISLIDFLGEQTNSNNKELFEKIAQAESKQDWKLKAKLKQDNLPFYSPCVIIGEYQNNGYTSKVKNELWKDYAHIKEFTGLFVLDFDHLKKFNIDSRLFTKEICTYFDCNPFY